MGAFDRQKPLSHAQVVDVVLDGEHTMFGNLGLNLVDASERLVPVCFELRRLRRFRRC